VEAVYSRHAFCRETSQTGKEMQNFPEFVSLQAVPVYPVYQQNSLSNMCKCWCPGWVGGGGGQFKQLHLPCALKGNRAHKTTRPSRHTGASVKLPPRHGAVVRVKEMSEFAQTCGLTSLKITVVNFWVMAPCNLAGVLVNSKATYGTQ
jgi:hypothetical protein